MKRFVIASLVGLSGALLLGAAQHGSGGHAEDQKALEDLMQIAIMQERAGSLDEAIRLYRAVIHLRGWDAGLTLEALIRMSRCEARQAFENFKPRIPGSRPTE